MPSDDLAAAAVAALRVPRNRFRSALAATVESVRAWVDEHRTNTADRRDLMAAEFGAMSDQLFSIDRLAELVHTGPAVDPSVLTVVERALVCLETLAAQPDGRLAVVVPPGGSLADTVADALAETGRVMGAARIVDLARQGRHRPAEHDHYLDAFPFGLWSQEERRLAPPLVVSVAGADLRPHALAEYLDGGMKFVLLVDAPATAAPLVRLITPGVFVAQTRDSDIVERLATSARPGIVALMPEGAAEFVHDPAAGDSTGGRLVVTTVPSGRGLHRVGPFSSEQQRDELQHLTTMTASSAVSSVGDGARRADDPVGTLAAWLLGQASTADDAKG